jgi:hypothetical protein
VLTLPRADQGASERRVEQRIRRVEDVAGIARAAKGGSVRANIVAVHEPYAGGERPSAACGDHASCRHEGTPSVKRRVSHRGGFRDPFSSDVGDAREYLERLGRILVHTGHSPKRLQREFNEICRHLSEPDERWDAARLNYVSDLPHVITHWHADAQYLDAKGAPRPLPLRGRGPNLSSLVRRVLPSANVEDVIRSLIDLKGIRRRGRLYAPAGQYLTYNQQRVSALAHGLTALLGMLRTVEHNIASPRAKTLFERAAINPSFPVADLASFHRRFKSVAGDFIWSIDGDMRRREARRDGGRRTRLGVGIFAFEEPRGSGSGCRGRRSSVRRTKARRR